MVRHHYASVLSAHRWQWTLRSHGPWQVSMMTVTSLNDLIPSGLQHVNIDFSLQHVHSDGNHRRLLEQMRERGKWEADMLAQQHQDLLWGEVLEELGLQ